MPIKNDLSNLPQGDKPEGRPPDEDADIVGRLAQAFYAKYMSDGRDTLAMAVEGARWRASWSDMCSRRVGYEIAGLEQTDPPGLAEFWRFNLGTFVHEAMQALAADAFPNAEAEVNVAIDDFGAAHVDLVIDEYLEEDDVRFAGRPETLRPDRSEGGHDRGLLGMDGLPDAERLRPSLGAQQADAGASPDVHAVDRPDTPGVDSGPSLSQPEVLQPSALGTSDAGREHASRGGSVGHAQGEDTLPKRAPVRRGGTSKAGKKPSPQVLDLPQDGETPMEPKALRLYRTVVEIKSDGGYHFKISTTSWKGPAEGPRSSAVVQGAVSAEALNADRLIVAVFALELLSPDMAAKAGRDELGRFSAQWTYLPDEFLAIAEKERKRVRHMIEIVDAGGLVPRHIPSEMPARARITDPARSAWTVQDDSGAIVMAGQVWNGQMCTGYCPHFSRCVGDGPS